MSSRTFGILWALPKRLMIKGASESAWRSYYNNWTWGLPAGLIARSILMRNCSLRLLRNVQLRSHPVWPPISAWRKRSSILINGSIDKLTRVFRCSHSKVLKPARLSKASEAGLSCRLLYLKLRNQPQLGCAYSNSVNQMTSIESL